MVKQQHGKQGVDGMSIDSEPPPLSIEAVRERLRPASDTAAALQASIELAQQLRTELQAGSAEAKRKWMVQQISGTPAAIAEAERAMVQQNKVLEFVEDYEGALSISLAKRDELDRQAVIDEAMARGLALKREADLAAEKFRAAWHRDYPAAATAIVALLKQEREAIERYEEATTELRRAEGLGAAGIEWPQHPTRVAVGALRGVRRLGDVVQLPGVYGAPFIPIESETRMETAVVLYRDWESTQGGWVPDQSGHLAPPLREREVEKPVTEYKSIREDRPFWVTLRTPLDGTQRLYKLI
jgi:hypothetical protein